MNLFITLATVQNLERLRYQEISTQAKSGLYKIEYKQREAIS